jgi:hypothetical protein
MDNYCLECGAGLKGRSDKKFCDSFCRNNFHNQQNAKHNNLTRKVNNILSRNRKILEYLSQKNCYCSEPELYQSGFDIRFFTHKQEVGNQIYICCYDFGYYIRNRIVYFTCFDREE